MSIAQQPAILTQACHALSALALLPENKTRIAEVNGIHVLLALLADSRPPQIDGSGDGSRAEALVARRDQKITESVQEAALAAVTNLTSWLQR